jgi:hypothetical protein
MISPLASRRTFLRAGVLGLGGLALPELFARRAAAGESNRDTSVILLYLHGGPSHLETYDLKPAAPTQYRSIFNPIPTTVPGMDVCELFPRQAKLADKFALVRSLNHDVSIHSDGGIVVLTGKRPAVLDPTSNSKSEHPDFGSVASHLRGVGRDAMPPFVAIPRQTYMTRPAYLGEQAASVVVNNPAAGNALPPQLSIAGRDPSILNNRRRLLAEIDQARRTFDAAGSVTSSDRFRQLAFDMLTSPKVAEAFDLSKEPAKLRDRYGRHLWGQACLLARRLAVAGTAVVSLYIDTPKSGPDWTNWDDHIMNAGRPGHFGDYMRRRLPYLDESLSALIEDIYSRGLDRRILVVVVGEFGRTPRLSTNKDGTGRDHWPQAYTALLSGGGLRTGQVIGATNARGEHPTQKPYTPQDLLATVYRHLGIDINHMLSDTAGRPVPVLAEGRPIPELV